jgi:hypothetical protein
MRPVHPVIVLFACCFLFLCQLNGQTTLNYGDIAIVGVASNIGDDDISAYCETGNATGRDRISIVCFKDLTAGTTIDLTDNGWERLIAGKWGNSEGFLSITRTGGTIPAGTTITFELPRTSSGQNPVCIVPDDNWSYASLGTRYVNFGSNGDQLYLMQDGVWNNGTGCPTACAHDATYTGGRVLYGFSSSGWVNTPPGSANGVNFSRLHPSVANCFNVSVPSNFASYQAPTSATTQAGWLTRIKTPADWVAYANCNAYQEPPPNFPISQADVSLSCSANCSGCAPLTTTLKLSIGLPSSWGPFTVVVSNGTNNITLSNAVNNQTFNVVSNSSTNYSIISISAANGCPLTYTFNTVPITVFTRPLYQNYTAQVCQGTSIDLSALTYQGTNITGNTLTFHSNTPPNAGNQLPSPNVTISGPITYYGLATNADGCRDTFPIQFTTIPAPNAGTAAAPFTQCFMSTGAGTLTLANSLTGEMSGGVWSLGAGSSNPGSNFNAVAGTLNLNNLAAGNYLFDYTVTAGACGSDVETVAVQIFPAVQISASTTNANCNNTAGTLTVTVNAGSSPYQFNIGQGNQNQPTFTNLAAGNYTVTVSDVNGCSVATFAVVQGPVPLVLTTVNTNPSCFGSNDGAIDLTVTGGQMPYTYDWSDDGPDNPDDDTQDISGLAAGTYSVTVTDNTGCTAIKSVTLSQAPRLALSAVIQQLNCAGGVNGSISLSVSGGTPGYSYDWNINAYDGLSSISNLGAGIYAVTVSDQHNCLIDTSFEIINGNDLNLSCAELNPVSTLGGSDGVGRVTASGNVVFPLNVQWAGPVSGTQTFNSAVVDITGLQAGAYNVTVTNALGCTADCSFVISNPNCVTDTVQIVGVTCDAGLAGVQIQHLVNQFGCDSVVITTTTLLPGDTTYLNAVTCDVTQVGVNQQVLTGVNGCDSLVITTTALLPADTTFLNATTCNAAQVGVTQQVLTGLNGCDSLVVTTTTLLPADTTFLTATTCNAAQVGVTQQVLTGLNGCDSLVVTTTTLLPADTTFLTATTCNAAQVGVTQQVLTGINGCDSLVITTTTLLPVDTTFLNATTCNAAQVGVSQQVLTSVNGCDSLVITTTTLLPSDTTFLNATTCNAAQVGVTQQILTGLNGCDSLVITTTTLLPSDTTFLTATTCNAAQVGVNQQVLTGLNGCDSLVITTTTLLPSDTTFLNATTCNAAQVGVTQQILTGLNGCDSLVITTTTLLLSDTTFLTATTCNAAQVGVNQQVLTGLNGCDSLVITTTTLLPADTTFLNATTCNATQVGVNQQVLTGLNGCDSLVITTTTLLPADTTFLTVTTCNAAQVGVNQQVLTGLNGCDSLVITTTTLLPADTTFLTATTCNAAQVGVNQQVLTGVNGCDSLVITTTTLLPADTAYLNGFTCDPIFVGETIEYVTNAAGCVTVVISTLSLIPTDTTYAYKTTCDPTQAGTTVQLIPVANGCDSVVITTTTLAASDTLQFVSHTCDPAQAGITMQHFFNQYGCDSVLITNTILQFPDTTRFYFNTCNAAQADTVLQQLTNINGCDSIVITATVYTPPAQGQYTAHLCSDQFVLINGVRYDAQNPNGTAVFPGAAASGCDSLVEVQLFFDALQVDFQANGPLCFGDKNGTIAIESVTGGTAPYKFSIDGTTFSNLPAMYERQNLDAGNYPYALVDSLGCRFDTTILLPAPVQINLALTPEFTIHLGDSIQLDASTNIVVDSLVWQNSQSLHCIDCLQPYARPFENTVYTLTVFDANGCSETGVVKVKVERVKGVYIPNVIMPDAAAPNNQLVVYADQSVSKVRQFHIFDRWGNDLFALNNFVPNNPALGWNGTSKGEDLNPGVYVYFLEVEYVDGQTAIIEGDVTLIR